VLALGRSPRRSRRGDPRHRVRTLAVLGSALFALLPLASAARAQTPYLVRDINTSGTGFGLRVDHFQAAAGRLFFTAGNGLWVSDGTASGTRRFAVVPGRVLQFFGSIGNEVFFAVVQHDRLQLWRSDGTRKGTFALTGGDPSFGGTPQALGQTFYFRACDRFFHCVLWASDGTLERTRPVTAAAGPSVEEVAVLGGKLYFLASGGGLWVSDGTAAGTAKVVDLPTTERSVPFSLVATAGRLFFVADHGGPALWTSDGTAAGTRPLAGGLTNDDPVSTPWLKLLGGRAYFVADDGIHGREIWASDGTPAGTRRLTELARARPFPYYVLTSLQTLGSRLLFAAFDASGQAGLWKTDGTPASTAPVAAVELEPEQGLLEVGGRLVYGGGDATHGFALWSTDGTPRGTTLLKDLCPPGGCPPFVFEMTSLLGGVVFNAWDARGDQMLWRTDGTAAGTRLVMDVGVGAGPGPGIPPSVAAFGGKLYFTAYVDDRAGLWVSAGTPASAHLLAEDPNGRSSSPQDLLGLGGGLLFSACNGARESLWTSHGDASSTVPVPGTAQPDCTHDFLPFVAAGSTAFFLSPDFTELWRTDGSGVGTFRLATFSDAVEQFWPPVALGGSIFLLVPSPRGDCTVWRSDGTVTGTGPAFTAQALTGPPCVKPESGGDQLYLAFGQPDATEVLWRSDGTAAGTVAITALPLSWAGSFTRVGSQILFFGFAEDTFEVWRTDGTAGGTSRVASLHCDASNCLSGSQEFRGALYFFADDEQGAGLWRSGGTAAGTTRLHSFGGAEPRIASFAPAGGQLFFVAGDAAHGEELWKTDGTAAGTVLVRDIAPGPATSTPRELTVAGDRIYFSADDGVHGVELWTSDGSEAGTHLVEDLAPEFDSSSPSGLTVVGDHLYFAADDGLSGDELWALPLAGPAGCQTSSTALCLNAGRFRVEATWRDFAGHAGVGQAVPLAADTGYFWFFAPGNVETVVKVLDGRGLNGAFWVFYGALSSVEYTLTVTDTATGLSRRYVNPPGALASVGDTAGFGPLGAYSTARGADPRALPEPAPAEARTDPRAATGSCAAGPTRLCLAASRFAVEADWKDFAGHTGKGTAVPLTPDTGYFWFFDPASVEVVTKLLDGRPVNGRFWFFYGALSSVEYALTVTDTTTGAVLTYRNPSGRLASVADTGAFSP
jgi:ELWxxDGT repeat protein